MTNEQIITKEFHRISACLNAICIFLSEEVLTDSQSKKLGNVMRRASNNLTDEEQEEEDKKVKDYIYEFLNKHAIDKGNNENNKGQPSNPGK